MHSSSGAGWRRFLERWFPRPLLSGRKGGPWGGGSEGGEGEGGGDGGGGDEGGPRNPWGEPPRRRKPRGGGEVHSLDEFLRKSRDRLGGRFPSSNGRPFWLYGLIGFALLWI